MASLELSIGRSEEIIRGPAAFTEPQWYAAYTCANHERRVAQQLIERGVDHFLPTFETVRRWKDRRMLMHEPLFSGYVFVHLALRDRLRVLQVPSVVRLVGFNGSATSIPDEEIETLRKSLTSELHALPHPYLRVGRRVQIVTGPLQGAEGILIRKKNAFRFVLSMDLIMRSASVEVESSDVRAISEPAREIHAAHHAQRGHLAGEFSPVNH